MKVESFDNAIRITTHLGFSFIIDSEDFAKVKDFKFYNSGKGYVVAQKNSKNALIHRIIMNCPPKMQIDHINGDRLDNRKSNLRICNNCQNNANKYTPRTNTSGYKGVWYRGKSWSAQIQVKGQTIRLGTFKNIEGAAQAYNDAALKYFGEFALLNKI